MDDDPFRIWLYKEYQFCFECSGNLGYCEGVMDKCKGAIGLLLEQDALS